MYVKLTNGQPEIYSIGQLRRDNPNTSFPKNPTDVLLVEWNIYPCTRPDLPDYDPLISKVVDGSFEQDAGGNWVWPYAVEQLPQADAERNIRAKRDRLLSDTDWVVVKAMEDGVSVSDNWKLYRQALRDITAQAGFPYSVVWPAKPE